MKIFINYLLIACLAVSLFSCQELILGEKETDDPENNFELLWNELDQHYSLFGVRNHNWDSIYTEFRPRITEEMSNDSLWSEITAMIDYLDDTHTSIYDPWNKIEFVSGNTLNEEAEELFSLELVQAKYVEDYTNLGDETQFAHAKVKEKNIGYIHINAMSEADPESIDEALEELKDKDALILDIRNNSGGDDLFSTRVAGAFADKEELIYTVQAKTGPEHDDFEEKRSFYSNVLGDSYLKPVVVLTDRYTVSAAEIFLLHMNSFDHVTQIGDSTSGDFSDVGSGKFLPNGWFYQYSIMKFLLPDGTSLDGVGHIPDVYVKNTLQDLENDTDKVMEKAFEYLFEEYGIN
ncbi:S41 family peptidase [Saprospiraceae bacterium]|nr:S41 family peptidase [Saprospiraceae bacterium]